jgi:hypothetical protein
MVNKIFLGIIGVLIYIFAMSWVFNHVNPWASIAMGVILVYGSIINLLNKKNKQK